MPANIVLNTIQNKIFRRKDCLDVSALSKTNLQCDRTAGSQMMPGMSGNDSVWGETIRPAIQSPDRVMQRNFALQSGYLKRWYVRRIGNDQIVGAGYIGKPVRPKGCEPI